MIQVTESRKSQPNPDFKCASPFQVRVTSSDYLPFLRFWIRHD